MVERQRNKIEAIDTKTSFISEYVAESAIQSVLETNQLEQYRFAEIFEDYDCWNRWIWLRKDELIPPGNYIVNSDTGKFRKMSREDKGKFGRLQSRWAEDREAEEFFGLPALGGLGRESIDLDGIPMEVYRYNRKNPPALAVRISSSQIAVVAAEKSDSGYRASVAGKKKETALKGLSKEKRT